MKEYVLVSQGIEIYRTTDGQYAKEMMDEENKDYYEYAQKCADNFERHADNEIEMFIEEK